MRALKMGLTWDAKVVLHVEGPFITNERFAVINQTDNFQHLHLAWLATLFIMKLWAAKLLRNGIYAYTCFFYLAAVYDHNTICE